MNEMGTDRPKGGITPEMEEAIRVQAGLWWRNHHDGYAPTANAALRDLCRALVRRASQETARRCRDMAMGSTGPGNTLDQSAGYSDACRDIGRAIWEEFGLDPAGADKEGGR